MQFRCLLPLFICFVSALFAADPPPGVDTALRQRVQMFYQLQVDHKFRQAEDLVAAESKDFYYESKKPELHEFAINRIEYAPDFRHAKVSLSSKTQVLLPGAGPVVLDMPFYTNWKIEDGKWCWYMDKDQLLQTPFGKVESTSEKGDFSRLPNNVSAATVMKAVEADHDRIELSRSKPGTQTIKLKNTLPGPVAMRLFTVSPALKLELSKTNLAANESAMLTVSSVPDSTDRPNNIMLNVQPMNQTITIGIDWVN